jgi:hypothetical protein
VKLELLLIMNSFGSHGCEIVYQTLEIMFPDSDKIWKSHHSAIKPLNATAYRRFVLLPTAIIQHVREDRKLSSQSEALDEILRSTYYGIEHFDKDVELEEEFARFSAHNLGIIHGNIPSKNGTLPIAVNPESS